VVHTVQTASEDLRERYALAAERQRAEIEAAVKSAGSRHLRLRTDSDWLTDLVKFVVSQRFRRGR